MQRVEHVMGMPVIADVRDDEADPRVLDDVFAWLRWVDATFSTYKADSEIGRINRGELAPEDADPEVRAVLDRCDELRRETNGYFDARAASPDVLDPSGLVKGWSIERAAGILDDAGVRNYALNAGGDIVVRGRAVPDWSWRIGIQHPRERDAVAHVVEARNLAIATSGEYERGQHVVDPHTRRPPSGLLSVTVTGPDLGTADAYATAAFAMGAAARDWVEGLDGYEAFAITAAGATWQTSGFGRYLG